jgi:hypothetical protein
MSANAKLRKVFFRRGMLTKNAKTMIAAVSKLEGGTPEREIGVISLPTISLY